ncbi:unnamed protein product [Paramecium sonneborni]|uniref:Transmembrane protein n=1 Tax=Paramecium sonneborni TaxID=65129 RepID=A0A8S1R0V2_9CILI|nr:unnamed protein product [Paramecium sonneborni]
MIKIYFFIVLFTTLIKGCSYLQNDAMKIISTPKEVINIQFTSIFKFNQYIKITLISDDDKFVIVKPIELTEKLQIKSLENNQVISYKFYKTKSSRDPLHFMAILVQSNDHYIVEYNSHIYSSLPQIDSITERIDQLNSICYDIIQVDSIFIVDCQMEDQDYFSIGQDKFIPIQKAKSQQRKLDQIDNYILRCTVIELELYIYEQNTVQFLKILDQNTMSELLRKENFKLEIRDFKTHTNGQFSILNAYGELIILEYNRDDNQWVLIENLDTKTQNAIGYDIDIETNQYVVIQEEILYFKSKTNQEYSVNVVLNEKSSVYLTKNYILFQKSDILILYDQKLEKLYSILMDQSKYRITSNPNFDSIIALGDTEIYRYTINSDYYLQFKSDNLQEQYSQIQIVQGLSPTKCQVTISYKVISTDTMEMFQTQEASALFAYGVNLDERVAQFQPVYQGPNLHYEFYNNDILKVQVNNHLDVEIVNLDSKDIVYRKAISNLNPQQIYFIQQKQNLDIEGFKCENISQTKINCNIWFEKITFLKLEDSSKQIWWMNQDGLYFANLNDKSVNIYYLSNYEKQFEQFQVIELQTQGNSLNTDGIHLFILVEKDVEIYTINSKEWKKLSIDFKGVSQVFSSPYQKDIVFIYDDIKLSLYSLQYQKLSLIWFTSFESKEVIKIAIAHYYFSILIKIQEVYEILVFNIENEGHIYFQRKLSLYHHAKADISFFDSNYFNDQIYIAGTHDITGKQEILVYKMAQVSLNSQFMILNITSSLISAANNFLFINDFSAQKFYSYFLDGNYFVSTAFDTSYQQQTYNKDIQLQGKVSNTDFNRLIKEVPISIINSGTQLFGIKKQLNFTYDKDENRSHCFETGQSWYNGQAFDIELQEPYGDIEYQKTLIKQTETIQSSESIMEFDLNTLVQLIQNKIILINKADFQTTQFSLDNKYTFNHILYIKDNLIYEEAISNDQYLLKLIYYQNSQFYLKEGEITYNYKIKKAYQHQDRFFIWILNYVIAYDTKVDCLDLNQYQVIKRIFPLSDPESIEILHIKDQIYYFFSISFSGQLEIIAYEIIKTSQKNFFFGI